MIILSNTLIQVSRYKVKSDKIPSVFNGFKIVQVSDLHSKSFGKNNSNLIKKIEKEKPDIVVMTGDMINTKDDNFDVFLDFAGAISRKYDTYYIVGNHEQSLPKDKFSLLINRLEQADTKVLDNNFIKINKGNDSINLYGMWFNLRYYKDNNSNYAKDINFSEETMASILGSFNKNDYNILLTHNPLYFETYSNWGVDLTLTGHIHGGMIRLPFLGGLLSPERKFFPKYDFGKYELNNKVLIVNRGLGNGDFGIRLLNNPDISVITLSN